MCPEVPECANLDEKSQPAKRTHRENALNPRPGQGMGPKWAHGLRAERSHRRVAPGPRVACCHSTITLQVPVTGDQDILAARQRAERELVAAKAALEARERELSVIYSSVGDVIFYVAGKGAWLRFCSYDAEIMVDARQMAVVAGSVGRGGHV